MDSRNELLVRPRYFFGQLLTVDDFQVEQDYHRNKSQLHNRSLHGYGVVTGLEPASSNGTLTVSPGLALDGYGREIIVPDEQTIVLSAPNKGSLLLCLRFEEEEIDGSPSPQGEAERTRIVERFRLTLEPDHGESGCVPLAVVAVERGAIVALDPSIRPRAGGVPELVEMIERLTQRVERIERRLKASGSRGDNRSL